MRNTIDMAREIAVEYSKAERFQTWTHDYMMERLMELVAVSAEAEREACAEICQQQSDLQLDERVMRGIDVCKDAIRARGQA
jgi:hypothetical protein